MWACSVHSLVQLGIYFTSSCLFGHVCLFIVKIVLIECCRRVKATPPEQANFAPLNYSKITIISPINNLLFPFSENAVCVFTLHIPRCIFTSNLIVSRIERIFTVHHMARERHLCLSHMYFNQLIYTQG